MAPHPLLTHQRGSEFQTLFAYVVFIIQLVNASPLGFLSTPFSTAWKRTGYFFCCIGITIPAINLVVLPMLKLFGGKGLLCFHKYRLMSNSWTTLQAKGGTFWLWIEFLIQVIILFWYLWLTIGDASGPNANGGKVFAMKIVNFFGVNRGELNFYKDYSGETNGNVALAAFVEALIGTWAMLMIQQYVVARRKKSQVSQPLSRPPSEPVSRAATAPPVLAAISSLVSAPLLPPCPGIHPTPAPATHAHERMHTHTHTSTFASTNTRAPARVLPLRSLWTRTPVSSIQLSSLSTSRTA